MALAAAATLASAVWGALLQRDGDQRDGDGDGGAGAVKGGLVLKGSLGLKDVMPAVCSVVITPIITPLPLPLYPCPYPNP